MIFIIKMTKTKSRREHDYNHNMDVSVENINAVPGEYDLRVDGFTKCGLVVKDSGYSSIESRIGYRNGMVLIVSNGSPIQDYLTYKTKHDMLNALLIIHKLLLLLHTVSR